MPRPGLLLLITAACVHAMVETDLVQELEGNGPKSVAEAKKDAMKSKADYDDRKKRLSATATKVTKDLGKLDKEKSVTHSLEGKSQALSIGARNQEAKVTRLKVVANAAKKQLKKLAKAVKPLKKKLKALQKKAKSAKKAHLKAKGKFMAVETLEKKKPKNAGQSFKYTKSRISLGQARHKDESIKVDVKTVEKQIEKQMQKIKKQKKETEQARKKYKGALQVSTKMNAASKAAKTAVKTSVASERKAEVKEHKDEKKQTGALKKRNKAYKQYRKSLREKYEATAAKQTKHILALAKKGAKGQGVKIKAKKV